MNQKSLTQMLTEYSRHGKYPMHMPGHKRNTSLLSEAFPFADLSYDITEIDGFDDLHNATGVIKELTERIAKLYDVKEAFISVNGSTAGILSAIRSAVKPGDKVIMGRNCHKSVYHALELCDLTPIYIYPEIDRTTNIACSISPEDIEKELCANENASLVILTSPTYEGVLSNIKEITHITHKYGARILVDCAHGAHLGISGSMFCSDRLIEYKYADYIVMSLHKTLPSLTQTAVVLANVDDKSCQNLSRQLGIFQTSSPSYLLMASIDSCINLLESESNKLFSDWENRISDFNTKASKYNNIRVVCFGNDEKSHAGFYDFDKSKLVISTFGTNMTGTDLSTLLRQQGIEPEMSSLDYVVCMTSVCDTEEGYDLLHNVLLKADDTAKAQTALAHANCKNTKKHINPYKAVYLSGNTFELTEAIGKISLSYVWAYPPGIPILVPGEVVDKETVDHILFLKKNGININTTKILGY